MVVTWNRSTDKQDTGANIVASLNQNLSLVKRFSKGYFCMYVFR